MIAAFGAGGPAVRWLAGLAFLCLALLWLASFGVPPEAAAQTPGEIQARTELRVCADPNNLPFSNEKGEGYENKIAEILGDELKLPARFVYFPQVTGFVRNTLRARSCDLVMGAVAGDDIVQTTTPYYYSGYVVVWPAG